jgi:ABC-2 type transport system ATP-binding protein
MIGTAFDTKTVASARGLGKRFGAFVALDGIDFSLQENKIYGLLGRNGAGKTTLMQIFTGQEFQTSGAVEIFGHAPHENSRALTDVCFVKESQKYPDDFKVGHVLATARHLLPHWNEEFAQTLLEDCDLPLCRKVKKLSRGMTSALGVTVGLASRAPLTLFDEPYLGLDAVARHLFYDRLLVDYAEHPRTVVLSTHLIDEVSDLIEHVILIDKGRIVLDEDTDAPREGAVIVITLQKWWPDIGHWFADAPRSVPMVWLPALVAAAGIVAAWALVRRATA